MCRVRVRVRFSHMSLNVFAVQQVPYCESTRAQPQTRHIIRYSPRSAMMRCKSEAAPAGSLVAAVLVPARAAALSVSHLAMAVPHSRVDALGRPWTCTAQPSSAFRTHPTIANTRCPAASMGRKTPRRMGEQPGACPRMRMHMQLTSSGGATYNTERTMREIPGGTLPIGVARSAVSTPPCQVSVTAEQHPGIIPFA